MQLGVKRLH